MKLVLNLGGKNVVLGEIYEDRLPSCTRPDCPNRIPIETVIMSVKNGNSRPLYCSPYCARLTANRKYNSVRSSRTQSQQASAHRDKEKRLSQKAALMQRRAKLAAARVQLTDTSLTPAARAKLQRWVDKEEVAIAKFADSHNLRRRPRTGYRVKPTKG